MLLCVVSIAQFDALLHIVYCIVLHIQSIALCCSVLQCIVSIAQVHATLHIVYCIVVQCVVVCSEYRTGSRPITP